MGPITWACLLLTVHQTPASEYHILERDFEIPISFKDPRRRNEVQELTLFVSQDKGALWGMADKPRAPTEKAFVYHAKADGSYWFIVQEKDRGGRLNPSDLARARPSQQIVVDTLKPRVQVTAERVPNSEDVLARWTITEEHPDPHSVRLDYHTAAMPSGQWTPLSPDVQSAQGEKRFNPASAGEVRVRVQIKDLAQNLGQGEAVVAAVGAPAAAAAPSGSENTTFGVIPTTQTTPPGTLASRQTTPSAGVIPPPSPPTPTGASLPLTPPAELNATPRTPAIAAPSPGGGDRSPATPGFTPETPHGALPPLKIVKERQVKLDFEVAKFGPSGLGGGADVYVTVNEGASWTRLPNELPVSLPPTTDLRGATPVRGSVSVQLPAETTIYGFIVAVKSKAGLARQAPKPGEPPQVRIELDASPPKAELIRPVPDQNQRDTLILAWNAVDRNLPANPITLEWAEHKEGPWRIIGEGPLPNNGQYPWHLPEGIPSRVFLKLTVRDTAGNAAEAKTDKPELIDLSVPETSIIGVGPASR
jgi:hypothetical protein